MQIRVNITAWGTYVSTMRSLLFPSLLAPDNLPALAARHHLLIDLCTTADVIESITDCPAFAQVTEYADINFVHVHPTRHKPHNVMSEAHAVTIRETVKSGGGCMFIQPDMLVADGSLRWLAEQVDNANAVMVCTPRAILPNVAALAFNRLISRSITPRQLMRIMLDHRHPVTESLIINGKQSSKWPSHLYWRAGNDGLVVRAFHLHPLFFVPADVPITTTIDGDYLQRCYPTGEGIVYAHDSDDLAIIELSEPGHMASTILHHYATFQGVKTWFHKRVTPLHIQHAKQKIRLVADTADHAAWEEVEQEADEFTRMFL